MGLFGCSHPKWVKVGKVKEGMQQMKCSKCGRLKMKKVINWGCVLFGNHKYHTRVRGRKHAPKVIKCTKCGQPKSLEQLKGVDND